MRGGALTWGERLRVEMPLDAGGLRMPLMLAEIGWMLMGLVDTVMVGRLPDAAVAMGAVALAQVLHNTLVYGLGGVLMALDTVVSQAHGAGKIEEAGRWLLAWVAGGVRDRGVPGGVPACWRRSGCGM